MKYLNLLILLALFSCQEKNHFITKHYYDTGELLSEITHRSKDSLKDGLLKEYYKNGKLKNKATFNEGIKIDTVFSYFETGELKAIEIFKKDSIHTVHYFKNGTKSLEGSLLKRKPPIEIGWFKLYREDKSLKDSLEYINLNGKGYLNQRKHFAKSKMLEKDSSRFFKFRLTQIKDSSYKYKISYEPKIKDAEVFLIVDKDINEDFSNIKELKMDTIYMNNNSITATITSDVPYKTLKGFFYERKTSIRDTINKDSIRMTIREKYTYFNDTTYIKGWKSEKNITPSKASII